MRDKQQTTTSDPRLNVTKIELYPDSSLFVAAFGVRPCMAIYVSVHCNVGFLPDMILLLLTLSYYHRGIRLNAMKRSCLGSQCSHLNALMGCSEGLDAFRFLFI